MTSYRMASRDRLLMLLVGVLAVTVCRGYVHFNKGRLLGAGSRTQQSTLAEVHFDVASGNVLAFFQLG